MTHTLGIHPGSGFPVRLCAKDMLRNWLVMAQSGWGKSLLLYGCIAWLLHHEASLPMLVLDGAGTLARNLFLHWYVYLEDTFRRLKETQDPHFDAIMWSLTERVIYMKVEDENASGASVNLARRQLIHDSAGQLRLETAKERVASIMGSLAFTTVDAETFRLVHKYGRAGFGVLTAAGRTFDELPLLFSVYSDSYRLRLREDIEARIGGLDLGSPVPPAIGAPGRFEWKQWQVIERLFSMAKNSGQALDHETGSTLRNFDWLLEHFEAYFCQETFDLGEFVSKGGVLLVETCSRNQHANANARAAIYALYQAALAGRRGPSLSVIDEQHNLNVDLFADYVAATARNAQNYHWFSLHSTAQLKAQLPTIWQACQRKIIGAIGEEDLARLVLMHLTDLRPDGLYLPTASVNEGWSDDTGYAHGRGTSSSITEQEGGIEAMREMRLDAGSPIRTGRPVIGSGPYAKRYRWALTPKNPANAATWNDMAREGQALLTSPAPHGPKFAVQDDTQTIIVKETPDRRTTTEASQENETWSKRSGRSGGTTRGWERIGIGEQLQILTPRLLNQPCGVGVHLLPGFEPFFVQHHPYSEPRSWPNAENRVIHALAWQRQRLEQRLRPQVVPAPTATPAILPASSEPAAVQADPAPRPAAASHPAPSRAPQPASERTPARGKRGNGPRPRWAGRKGGAQ